jgi:hypothetical protein
VPDNAETPDFGKDEFDKDITSENVLDEGDFLRLALAEIHETFLAMRDVGFTEAQALRYLAFCSIHRGDHDHDE